MRQTLPDMQAGDRVMISREYVYNKPEPVPVDTEEMHKLLSKKFQVDRNHGRVYVYADNLGIALCDEIKWAQAIVFSILENQKLRTAVDSLTEQNKRLSSIIKNHIDSANKDKI